MVIEVNTKSLIDGGLTPNQFTILKTLFEKKIAIAKQLMVANDYRSDIAVLKHKQYLLQFDATGFLLNDKKCKELFELPDSSFWELFNMYPIKVPAKNGGYRTLRAGSESAKDTEVCIKRYTKAIKSREMHDFVLECLELELAMRRKSDSMQFMQELSVWLNQRTWEKYAPMLEEKDNITVERHGETLI